MHEMMIEAAESQTRCVFLFQNLCLSCKIQTHAHMDP